MKKLAEREKRRRYAFILSLFLNGWINLAAKVEVAASTAGLVRALVEDLTGNLAADSISYSYLTLRHHPVIHSSV